MEIPKHPNREVFIKFRVDYLEREIIKQKANESSRSMSSYVRDSALEKKIDYKMTDEELELFYLLIEYKNNFERIKNLIANKDHKLWQEVETTSQEIKRILNKF